MVIVRKSAAVRQSDNSDPPEYHPGMDEWIDPATAGQALGVGASQLGGLARLGLLRRTFDRPESQGRPRYEAHSVAALAHRRAELTDPEWWLTRSEACALLEVTPRAWLDLRRSHGVRDNGSPVTRWHRYSRADVLSLVRSRRPGALTRFLTESQAAEQLGTSTEVLRQRVADDPSHFGYNHRTRRYSAARVGELAS